MGIEYRLSCPPAALPRLEVFLLRLGGQPCSQSPARLEFHLPPSCPGQMPAVTVVPEAEGLYFCDHGGEREAVALLFRRIIDELLVLSDSSDSIVITAL